MRNLAWLTQCAVQLTPFASLGKVAELVHTSASVRGGKVQHISSSGVHIYVMCTSGRKQECDQADGI